MLRAGAPVPPPFRAPRRFAGGAPYHASSALNQPCCPRSAAPTSSPEGLSPLHVLAPGVPPAEQHRAGPGGQQRVAGQAQVFLDEGGHILEGAAAGRRHAVGREVAAEQPQRGGEALGEVAAPQAPLPPEPPRDRATPPRSPPGR